MIDPDKIHMFVRGLQVKKVSLYILYFHSVLLVKGYRPEKPWNDLGTLFFGGRVIEPDLVDNIRVELAITGDFIHVY